ncbi:hypothetical protein KHC33_12165 [Methanospirillum sp. J.3.6.1-F.2.7.3]|uniref:Uncharacterized protein n=1 Tax=Methanospirillum purgamenti TaxID=2834276 RepID=A0A8E7AVK1_9EURY|nr:MULTISPECIES: hypothetical protein [Methanospirillum]MDX8550388.1 hypothetical protein [Methanospirillum hungatei]QVV88085.1 hypothetical protein KHC33_12165 [Methanospirillum sp. J.3.6.1-F.2.7.3]
MIQDIQSRESEKYLDNFIDLYIDALDFKSLTLKAVGKDKESHQALVKITELKTKYNKLN